MKKIALIAALAVGSSLVAAEAAKSSYTVSVDFPYVSKYVFRGVEVAKDAIQPSIEVATADFYAGVWTSQPVTNNADNEFDFYAGYKAKINDYLSADAGATLYYYPELNKSSGGKRSTTEGFLGLNSNIKGFTPGVYGYYDFDLKTTTIQTQLGYSLPLPEKGLTLDLSANFGRVILKDTADYSYWSIGATIPYKLNETSTVYAGVSYINNNLKAPVEGDFLTYTVGLTVGF